MVVIPIPSPRNKIALLAVLVFGFNFTLSWTSFTPALYHSLLSWFRKTSPWTPGKLSWYLSHCLVFLARARARDRRLKGKGNKKGNLRINETGRYGTGARLAEMVCRFKSQFTSEYLLAFQCGSSPRSHFYLFPMLRRVACVQTSPMIEWQKPTRYVTIHFEIDEVKLCSVTEIAPKLPSWTVALSAIVFLSTPELSVILWS